MIRLRESFLVVGFFGWISFVAFVVFASPFAFAGRSPSAAPATSPALRVMTFNVMCDFCSKGNENGTFAERLIAVADTINRHNPDLISLQELRTGEQVELLRASLFEKYTPLYAEDYGISYADPTLLVRSARFKVLEKDGLWLGPEAPNFGFGWKTSFPRRIEYARLFDGTTESELIFVGAHFDNNPRNREPSAELLVKRFGESSITVIFAGDTNLRPDRGGYETLTKGFRDTFADVIEHAYITNRPTVSTDGCNLDKGPIFPACRVDHVLVSRKSPWKTSRWSVDTFHYPSMKGFISDHRAIVVEFSR